jgi:hypothetical protein
MTIALLRDESEWNLRLTGKWQIIVSASGPPLIAFEIRWRNPAIRRRETAMAISSNPLRSEPPWVPGAHNPSTN